MPDVGAERWLRKLPHKDYTNLDYANSGYANCMGKRVDHG